MISVHYRQSAYHLRLQNLLNSNNKMILLKFDTGAVNTIISLYALVGKNNVEAYRKRIIGLLKSKPKEQLKKLLKTFKSASGNNMIGILCHANNVNLSGYELSNFYYYLIINVNRSVALLGDDFISCCEFNHIPNSNIEITKYDDKLYASKVSNLCIQTDELYEIFNDTSLQITDTEGNELTDEEIIKEIFECED